MVHLDLRSIPQWGPMPDSESVAKEDIGFSGEAVTVLLNEYNLPSDCVCPLYRAFASYPLLTLPLCFETACLMAEGDLGLQLCALIKFISTICAYAQRFLLWLAFINSAFHIKEWRLLQRHN